MCSGSSGPAALVGLAHFRYRIEHARRDGCDGCVHGCHGDEVLCLFEGLGRRGRGEGGDDDADGVPCDDLRGGGL